MLNLEIANTGGRAVLERELPAWRPSRAAQGGQGEDDGAADAGLHQHGGGHGVRQHEHGQRRGPRPVRVNHARANHHRAERSQHDVHQRDVHPGRRPLLLQPAARAYRLDGAAPATHGLRRREEIRRWRFPPSGQYKN